jgi:large subunit ribosomal protein L25
MAKIASNTIEAQPRQAESRGKNEARRLRRSGKLPAVLYGGKKDTLAISVDPKAITQILHSASGHNTILEITVDGERTKAMIVDWQYEPIKDSLLHVDLKRIAMDQRLKVNVPIELQGEPEGVKTQGGILEQMLREVEIECLPDDIPGHIDVDVSNLVFGMVIRVADLPHDPKLKFLSDPNAPVAHITSVKEEEVAAPAEAVAGEAAAAPAEPEVIKKGKQEVTEEGEGAAPEAKAEKPERSEKKEKK